MELLVKQTLTINNQNGKNTVRFNFPPERGLKRIKRERALKMSIEERLETIEYPGAIFT